MKKKMIRRMKERKNEEIIRDKIGEILGVIFEHTWMYYFLIILMIAMIIGFQIIAFQRYDLQLKVLVASHYQLEMMLCDMCSIILSLLMFCFIVLYVEYNK